MVSYVIVLVVLLLGCVLGARSIKDSIYEVIVGSEEAKKMGRPSITNRVETNINHKETEESDEEESDGEESGHEKLP